MAQLNQGKRFIVIGGGLGGLSYVHYLRNFLKFFNKNDAIQKITLLESNDYMGGQIKSRVYEDGVVHELGHKNIRFVGIKARNTCALLEQAGLAERVICFTKKSSTNYQRYVYTNGKFYEMSVGYRKLFSKMPASKSTLFAAIWHDLFKAGKMDLEKLPFKDPSVHDFIAHRFGRDIADHVADPFMRALTTCNSRSLSMKAIANDLLEREQAHGSIIKGIFRSPPPTLHIKHDELLPNDVIKSDLIKKVEAKGALTLNLITGLQTLPEHLCNSLLNTNDDELISVHNQTRVVSVKFNNRDSEESPCSVVLRTIDGDEITLEGDHIVSTLAAPDFAKLISNDAIAEQTFALEHIAKFKHVPFASVVLEYRNLNKKPEIFNSLGFITQSSAGSKLLSVSLDTNMFPEIDLETKSIRVNCSMGGAWCEETFGTTDLSKVTKATAEQIVLEEVSRLLKITDEPHRISTHLWHVGLPHCEPGHIERVAETRDRIKQIDLPLSLLGMTYDGLSINDVLWASRQTAHDMAKSL